MHVRFPDDRPGGDAVEDSLLWSGLSDKRSPPVWGMLVARRRLSGCESSVRDNLVENGVQALGIENPFGPFEQGLGIGFLDALAHRIGRGAELPLDQAQKDLGFALLFPLLGKCWHDGFSVRDLVDDGGDALPVQHRIGLGVVTH